MADRFYCPDLTGSNAVLSDAEAHHALHVMRVSVGQKIELFNGQGTLARGVVQKSDRRSVSVEIQGRTFHERSTTGSLTLAVVAPKGDRLKWMIEKLTELGVDHYIPLITERSVVEPGKSKRDKLEATVISACKQSGRAWLLDIDEPRSLADVLRDVSAETTLHLCHPTPPDEMPIANEARVNRQVVLVGPEGGFTDNEVDSARQAGARPLCWPDTILRIETAAIMAAVIVKRF